MARTYEETMARMAELEKAQSAPAPAPAAVPAPTTARVPAVPTGMEALPKPSAALPAPSVTRRAAGVPKKVEEIKAPKVPEVVAPPPPKLVLPPDVARVIDYKKVFDNAYLPDVKITVDSAATDLGMSADELQRVAQAQGVDLDALVKARNKGRTYDEIAKAGKERGVIGFMTPEERTAAFNKLAQDVEKAQTGDAGDTIELVRSGADRGFGPAGALGGYTMAGTQAELPEVTKPGEHGYAVAQLLVDALQKDPSAVTAYDLYGRSIATGNTQKYIDQRVEDLRKRANIKVNDPGAMEKMAALRKRAINEVIAYKTVGQWTPVVTLGDVEVREGRASPGVLDALKPNIEIIGFNNKRQAVFRQESPMGVLFRVIDIPQAAITGVLSGQTVGQGIQSGANLLEYSLDATKDSAAYVKAPAVAAGFAASILFPDALAGAGEAVKAVKAASRTIKARKIAPEATALLETIARARKAGDYETAAAAEKELRSALPDVASNLDSSDAAVARFQKLAEPQSDILETDLAALIANAAPEQAKVFAGRPFLHPSDRKAVTGPAGIEQADYAELYDTRRLLDRVQKAKTEYVNARKSGRSLSQYAKEYVRGRVLDVFENLPAERQLSAAQVTRMADLISAQAPTALLDQKQFKAAVEGALKADKEFGTDAYKMARQDAYKAIGGRTETKIAEMRGKTIEEIEAADIGLFDRALKAIEQNNTARGVAAQLLRDEIASTARLRVEPLELFDEVAPKLQSGEPIRLTSGGLLLLHHLRKAFPEQDFKQAYATITIIDKMIEGAAKSREVSPFALYQEIFPAIRRGTPEDLKRLAGELKAGKVPTGGAPAGGAPTAPAAPTKAAIARAKLKLREMVLRLGDEELDEIEALLRADGVKEGEAYALDAIKREKARRVREAKKVAAPAAAEVAPVAAAPTPRRRAARPPKAGAPPVEAPKVEAAPATFTDLADEELDNAILALEEGPPGPMLDELRAEKARRAAPAPVAEAPAAPAAEAPTPAPALAETEGGPPRDLMEILQGLAREKGEAPAPAVTKIPPAPRVDPVKEAEDLLRAAEERLKQVQAQASQAARNAALTNGAEREARIAFDRAHQKALALKEKDATRLALAKAVDAKDAAIRAERAAKKALEDATTDLNRRRERLADVQSSARAAAQRAATAPRVEAPTPTVAAPAPPSVIPAAAEAQPAVAKTRAGKRTKAPKAEAAPVEAAPAQTKLFPSIEPLARTTPSPWAEAPKRFVVAAESRLRKAAEDLDAGRIDQVEYDIAVGDVKRDLAAQKAERAAKKSEAALTRGADEARAKLLKAKAAGVIDEAGADLAEWLIRQNPRIADDLNIAVLTAESAKKRFGVQAGEEVAGFYEPVDRVVALIKERGSELTATHEVLHHTEQMLPEAIQTAVRDEWAKQIQKALSAATPEQRPALEKALVGNPTELLKGVGDGTLPPSFYQYSNPSEFWAVNASRIVSGRYAAFNKGLVAKAKQWLTEFVQKVKSAFGLSSDAPVIRGLDDVLQGKGTAVSNMLSEGAALQVQRSAAAILDELKKTQFISTPQLLQILGDSRPEYLDNVASFILEQRNKVREGRLTVRDVAKAYLPTVASQRAGAIDAARVEAILGPLDDRFIVFGKKGQRQVRPEEAMAAWMFSPNGQRALDALDRGEFDADAWETVASLRDIWGNNTLRNSGVFSVPKSGAATMQNLQSVADEINAAGGDIKKVEAAVRKLNGIGNAKTPFISHLLGFGESPTMDAVEFNGWLTGRADIGSLTSMEADLARDLKARQDVDKIAVAMADRAMGRFRALRAEGVPGTDLPDEVFGAIMHHWFWDKLKDAQTTHEGMYDALRYASVEAPTPSGITEATSRQAAYEEGLAFAKAELERRVAAGEDRVRVARELLDTVPSRFANMSDRDLGIRDAMSGTSAEAKSRGLVPTRRKATKASASSAAEDAAREVRFRALDALTEARRRAMSEGYDVWSGRTPAYFDEAQEAYRKAKETTAFKQVSPTGKVKGLTEFLEDGSSIIYLFEGADASTVLHEVAHVVRRNLLSNEDMGFIASWVQGMGVNVGHQYGEFTGDAAEIEKAEELFAKAFEQYVAEGKAPAGLEGAFAQLKDAVANVYKAVKDPVIGVELQPEVRRVFDGLFATEPTQADQSLKEAVRRGILGGPEAEVDILTVLSREAKRKGLGALDVDTLATRVNEAKANIKQILGRDPKGTDVVLKFDTKVLGKDKWTLDDLAAAQAVREKRLFPQAETRMALLRDLTGKGRGKAAVYKEDNAVDALWTALSDKETDAPMTKQAKKALRGVTAMFFGGNVLDEKIGETTLANQPPAFRRAMDTSARIVEQSLADTVALVNDAVETKDDAQLLRYLTGDFDVAKVSGRPILSSGHDKMGAVNRMVQRAIAAFTPEEKDALTLMADTVNIKDPAARGERLVALGFVMREGEKFTEADEVRKATSDALYSAIGKLLYPEKQDADIGTALAAAIRDAVNAPEKARPSHEFRLVETLSYIGGVTARDGELFKGDSKDMVRTLLGDIRDIYGKSGEEYARRVAVQIGAFGGADQAKQFLVRMNLGVDKDTQLAFSNWLNGRQPGAKNIAGVDEMIKKFGIGVDFVPDAALDVDFYIPRAARDRMAQVLARARFRTGEAVGAADALATGYRYMKTRMTRGNFFIKQRYFMMNTVDHFNAMAYTEGFGIAAASTARVIAQDLVIIPGVREILEIGKATGVLSPAATEKLRANLQKLGDRGAARIGKMMSVSKYRIEVNPILEGVEGGFTVGGKVYRYRDIRDIAVEEGVFSSFDTRELQRAILREGQLVLAGSAAKKATVKSPSTWAVVTDRLASLEGSVSDIAEAWSERERLGAMVTLMEAGYDPRTAAQITIKALFDYSQSMTKLDRHWLVGMLLPFWAFQKNANRQVFNTLFSPWTAYRMMVVKRARERSSDLLTHVLYNTMVDDYGVDVESMSPELQDSYYSIIKAFEEAYGADGPPEDHKRAMRMLLSGRAVDVEGGVYQEASAEIQRLRMVGSFADLAKFAPYTIAAPSKAARSSYMRDRTGFAAPFPRTEGVRAYNALLGDNHSYMELYWPDSTIEAGMKWHTQVAATMFLLAAKGASSTGFTDLEDGGIDEVGWLSVVKPIVDAERSPILGPFLAGEFTKPTPKRIAEVATPEGVKQVHPMLGKMMDDLYGTTFLRLPAVVDPFVVNEDGTLPTLTPEQTAEIRRLQEQYPDVGVLKKQRYYIPGGVWATAFENSPLGELNSLLIRLEDEPLESQGRQSIQGKILIWARKYAGVDVTLTAPSQAVKREEPKKKTTTAGTQTF